MLTPSLMCVRVAEYVEGMFKNGYRWAAVAAVPSGVGLGVLVAVSFYLAGNPDYRAQGGGPALAYLLGVGVVLGGVTALVALMGGVAGIAWARRRGTISRSRAITAGATAAGIATAVLYLAIGFVNAVVTASGASWLGFIVLIAAVVGATTAIATAVVLQLAVKRSARVRSV